MTADASLIISSSNVLSCCSSIVCKADAVTDTFSLPCLCNFREHRLLWAEGECVQFAPSRTWTALPRTQSRRFSTPSPSVWILLRASNRAHVLLNTVRPQHRWCDGKAYEKEMSRLETLQVLLQYQQSQLASPQVRCKDGQKSWVPRHMRWRLEANPSCYIIQWVIKRW